MRGKYVFVGVHTSFGFVLYDSNFLM